MSTTVDPAGTTTVPAGGPAWGTTWPVLDGFRALARSRRVVPVVRRLLADDVTPVGLYRTLAQGRPGTFVLESAAWGRGGGPGEVGGGGGRAGPPGGGGGGAAGASPRRRARRSASRS